MSVNVNKRYSPCYKCQIHKFFSAREENCKLVCGCFKTWEPLHLANREKVYNHRRTVFDANQIRFDSIEEGRRVRWTNDSR